MDSRRHAVLLLITATLAVGWLMTWSVAAFGIRSPVSAFLVNWLVMAWMATAALFTRLPLPSRYYDIQAWERSGRIYECLGVRIFQKLVRRGPLSVFSRDVRLRNENVTTALRLLDQKMRRAEAIHTMSFLTMWLYIGYAMLRNWFEAAGWLLLFNSTVNCYPIMLQRYNRIRVQKLLTQEERRAKSPRSPSPHAH